MNKIKIEEFIPESTDQPMQQRLSTQRLLNLGNVRGYTQETYKLLLRDLPDLYKQDPHDGQIVFDDIALNFSDQDVRPLVGFAIQHIGLWALEKNDLTARLFNQCAQKAQAGDESVMTVLDDEKETLGYATKIFAVSAKINDTQPLLIADKNGDISFVVGGKALSLNEFDRHYVAASTDDSCHAWERTHAVATILAPAFQKMRLN